MEKEYEISKEVEESIDKITQNLDNVLIILKNLNQELEAKYSVGDEDLSKVLGSF